MPTKGNCQVSSWNIYDANGTLIGQTTEPPRIVLHDPTLDKQKEQHEQKWQKAEALLEEILDDLREHTATLSDIKIPCKLYDLRDILHKIKSEDA